MLGVPTIMVSLLDGQKKFIKCGTGLVAGGGISLDPPAICHWSLVPTLHQVIIVEDTHQDARFDSPARHFSPPYAGLFAQVCPAGACPVTHTSPNLAPVAIENTCQ